LGNCTTRDVTPKIILRHTKLLGNLCQAEIPAFGAPSFLLTSETSDKEHCRMALFKECGRGMGLALPKTGPLGLSIEDTGQGALVITNVEFDGTAYRQGFRDGDYISYIGSDSVEATDTLSIFGKKMTKAKKQASGPSLSFVIKRPCVKTKYT